MGKTVRMISSDGFIAASAIDATDIVQRAHEIHGTSHTASAALGRVLAVTSLIGGGLKVDGGSVTVRFDGDGAGGRIIAVAASDGAVRGWVERPMVDLERREDGKLDVGSFVGHEGSLTIIKDLGMRDPYVGTVGLVGGEVAEDIAGYFVESEQIPTACAAGVLVAPDGSILSAGAYLVQLLPGAGEDVVDKLERAIVGAGAVTKLFSAGNGPEAILRTLLDGFDPIKLDEYETPYRCDCSLERVERALVSTGKAALQEMIEKDRGAEVTCQFCDKVYRFTSENLAELLKRATRD